MIATEPKAGPDMDANEPPNLPSGVLAKDTMTASLSAIDEVEKSFLLDDEFLHTLDDTFLLMIVENISEKMFAKFPAIFLCILFFFKYLSRKRNKRKNDKASSM